MALVPFSVSGASASQDLEERLMQVGPFSLMLRQRPEASGNTAHLTKDPAHSSRAAAAPAGGQDQQQQQQPAQQPDLSRVGLVLWQSGYVLADFLLLRLQAAGGAVGSSRGGIAGGSSGSWVGVRVLELGCGGGTVGLFLALAGAQVVLTDQEHILPLTTENLHLNFPAAMTASSHHGQPPAQGTCTAQQEQEQQQQQQQQHLHAEDQAGACAAGASQQQSVPAAGTIQQPMSAADAFAAAFGAPGASLSLPKHPQQQQQQQQQQSVDLANWLCSAGPLVVQYSWGEPLQLLQDRITAVAAAWLAACQPAAAAGVDNPSQPQGSTTLSTPQQQQRQQQQQTPVSSHAAGSPPAHALVSVEDSSRADEAVQAPARDHPQQLLSSQAALQQWAQQGYDVVVGADLLYDMTHHAALLHSLQQLAAASPHLQVFLCWRFRALGEEAFLEAAAAAGWVVEEVPVSLLHPEFQTGYYRLVRMVRLP